jgi:hypothetical protein
MQYWRMQLHPSESAIAARHSIRSVATGFIGLDFAIDPGDLTKVDSSTIPQAQRDYADLAHRMQLSDKVLIIAHHFPFALVTVAGEYNYIRSPVPEIGVWFRHFRRIDPDETRYYADYVTNAHKWKRLIMTDTLSILTDPNSESYKLIDNWR